MKGQTSHTTPLIFLLASLAWVGCRLTEPEHAPDVASLPELQERLASVTSLRGEAKLQGYTQASETDFFRWGTLDWSVDQGFTLSLKVDSSGAFEGLYHLSGTTLTHLQTDSVRKTTEVDPFGDPIPNHYTQLLIPQMLRDTSWFAAWAADSTLEMKVEGGKFIVTQRAKYDPADENYHIESHASETWAFDAKTGVPLRMRDVWYRGDLAYGNDMTVAFEWTAVNDPAVLLTVADWVAPDWSREPDPEAPVVAGVGGDEDWYETTLAKLPAVGSLAPALAGQNLAGERDDLASHRGKLVYLDFWYIGCGPCMQALPHLAELAEKYGDEGFEVLAANPYQKREVINRYLNRRGLSLPQLVLDSVPKADWPVMAYPTWFLIDRDGRVIERDMGFGGEETATYLDSLVGVNL